MLWQSSLVMLLSTFGALGLMLSIFSTTNKGPTSDRVGMLSHVFMLMTQSFIAVVSAL